jgi:pyridoxine kinase
MKHQKRIAAIHDISGFGKCSLTVALPVLSAASLETSVIPTAVLSTHTGGFTGYTCRDLTEDLRPIGKHWKSLGIKFDAIYSGFLGSFDQLHIVSEILDDFRQQNNLILIDPVMADNGTLYKVFTPEFVLGMKELCRKADMIVPNMTEAALLTGEPYAEGPYDREYIVGLLKNLSAIGPEKIVLTGVFFDELELGAATYDQSTGDVSYVMSNRIPGYYHGTGDVFGSALLAAILNGFDLTGAASIAVDFTTDAIRRTFEAQTDVRFGVNFEQCIPGFLKKLGLMDEEQFG